MPLGAPTPVKIQIYLENVGQYFSKATNVSLISLILLPLLEKTLYLAGRLRFLLRRILERYSPIPHQ